MKPKDKNFSYYKEFCRREGIKPGRYSSLERYFKNHSIVGNV